MPHTPSTATQTTVPRQGRKVLLVGATGFLGAKILRELARDESLALRAMSRRGAPADAASGVEWVRGDMMDPASLDAALQWSLAADGPTLVEAVID